MHEGTVEARGERLGPSSPDLHSAETESNTRDQTEGEDRGPGVEEHSESTSGRTFGDVQDDRSSDNLVQSGRSKGAGKSWCSGHTIVRTDHY